MLVEPRIRLLSSLTMLLSFIKLDLDEKPVREHTLNELVTFVQSGQYNNIALRLNLVGELSCPMEPTPIMTLK